MPMTNAAYAQMLDWRGIEHPHLACPTCEGSGIKVYPTTSTWRDRPGGATATVDVCDTCWGTGRRDRTGVDLRAMAEILAGRDIDPAATIRLNVGQMVIAFSYAVEELVASQPKISCEAADLEMGRTLRENGRIPHIRMVDDLLAKWLQDVRPDNRHELRDQMRARIFVQPEADAPPATPTEDTARAD